MADSVREQWARRTKAIKVVLNVEIVALLVLLPLVYFLDKSYLAVAVWPLLIAIVVTPAFLKCPGCRKTTWGRIRVTTPGMKF